MLGVNFYTLLVLIIGAMCCQGECGWGQFQLDKSACRPWLQCQNLEHLPIGRLLGYGAVKKVYASKWQDQDIALVFLNNELYTQDFLSGLNNLKVLSLYHRQVVTLVGYCEESRVYVTELFPFGDASNYHKYIISMNLTSHYHELLIKLGFCIKYVEIIDTLHSFPLGPMVMCDSNSLEKTLEQYLLSGQYSILLSDADALPLISTFSGEIRESFLNIFFKSNLNKRLNSCHSYNSYTDFVEIFVQDLLTPILGTDRLSKSQFSDIRRALRSLSFEKHGVRCGHRQLWGDFVAPEQRTAHTHHRCVDCDSGDTNLHDESTDVFKVPTLCDHFLGHKELNSDLRSKFDAIHEMCNRSEPRDRPSARKVLATYKATRRYIIQKYHSHSSDVFFNND